MNCVECGTRMRTRKQSYRYAASGLPGVVLEGVEVRRCRACGIEEVAIPRIEQLHRVIAESIVRKPARLAGVEIRYLRKHLGWSTRDFAMRMGAARETVSRWEGGRTPIGPQADRLLRLLVVNEQPVADYSSDSLTEIGTAEHTPIQVRLARDRSGWHLRAA